jgi:hypothetical protein
MLRQSSFCDACAVAKRYLRNAAVEERRFDHYYAVVSWDAPTREAQGGRPLPAHVLGKAALPTPLFHRPCVRGGRKTSRIRITTRYCHSPTDG